jgi:DNA modification methylase
MKAPRLKIEYLPVDILKPASRNARTHTKKQVAALVRSIERFGMVTAIGIDDSDTIIYGHARARAAVEAGLTEVPVVRLTHMTQDERRAYLLADNRLAMDAGWDKELLAIELQELQALEFDLPILGFSLPEIDKLYDDLADGRLDGRDADEDAIPDRQTNHVTLPGDVWLLGHHRLICGDARDPEIYAKLLDGEEVGVIFCDPPYNVKIENNVSGLGKVRHGDFAMASGEMNSGEFVDFLTDSLRPAAAACRNGAIAFICMDWRHMVELTTAGLAAFDELKNVCIWNKKNAGMGAFYRSKYEMVFVFKKGDAPHINTFGLGQSGRHRSNVWDYSGVSSLSASGQDELAMHPTVKPVAMIVDALKDCSARGDVVLDNFGGSGSTLIAAEKAGRRARVIELDQGYCDVIIRRWQTLTGKEARRESTAETFESAETPSRISS